AFLAKYADIAGPLAACLDGLLALHGRASDSGGARDRGLPSGLPTGTDMPLGDYRLVREIGHGGMGVVYEAQQLSLARRVALKVLPFAATRDPRQLQRFQTEARAAAGLEHPHVVPVYGVGCERGVHFYVMKFIDGRSLAELIAQERERAARGRPGAGGTTSTTVPAA